MTAGIAEREPVPVTDGARIAARFAAHGAVHVRGALDAALVDAVAADVTATLAAWAAMRAGGTLPAHLDEPEARGYVPLALVASLAEPAAVLPAAATALARAYLGKEPEVFASSHVRRVPAARSDVHLPFHQDDRIVGRRALNVWIPLNDCGEDAPGLEIVTGSAGALLEPDVLPSARYPVERARLDPARVVDAFGASAMWRPAFRRGDAMLFAGATIHRTHATPHMTADRLSIEMRLV